MPRTIVNWSIEDETVENVEKYIINWLEKIGFNILTLNSDGSLIKCGYPMSKVSLKPNIGSLVSIYYGITIGAIVFEFKIQAINNRINIHGEFYAAGASYLAGKEYDLTPKSGLKGKYPRENGYLLMKNLEKYLKTSNKEDFDFKTPLKALTRVGDKIIFIDKKQLYFSIFGISIVILIGILLKSRIFISDFKVVFSLFMVYLISPIILVPSINNFILYFTVNRKMDKEIIFKRCTTLGSVYIIIGSLILFTYGIRIGDAYSMIILLAFFMLLIYGAMLIIYNFLVNYWIHSVQI